MLCIPPRPTLGAAWAPPTPTSAPAAGSTAGREVACSWARRRPSSRSRERLRNTVLCGLVTQKGLTGSSWGYVRHNGLVLGQWLVSGKRAAAHCMFAVFGGDGKGGEHLRWQRGPLHPSMHTSTCTVRLNQSEGPSSSGHPVRNAALEGVLEPASPVRAAPTWSSLGKKGQEALLGGAALPFSAPKSGFQVLPSKNFTRDVCSGSASPSETCWRRAVTTCQAPAWTQTALHHICRTYFPLPTKGG